MFELSYLAVSTRSLAFSLHLFSVRLRTRQRMEAFRSCGVSCVTVTVSVQEHLDGASSAHGSVDVQSAEHCVDARLCHHTLTGLGQTLAAKHSTGRPGLGTRLGRFRICYPHESHGGSSSGFSRPKGRRSGQWLSQLLSWMGHGSWSAQQHLCREVPCVVRQLPTVQQISAEALRHFAAARLFGSCMCGGPVPVYAFF